MAKLVHKGVINARAVKAIVYPQELPRVSIQFICDLGQGEFGKVQKAYCTANGHHGYTVAVKVGNASGRVRHACSSSHARTLTRIRTHTRTHKHLHTHCFAWSNFLAV